MTLKLAILCPIHRKITPGDDRTVENKISALAEALARLDVEVTLMAVDGSQSPGWLVAIAARGLEEGLPTEKDMDSNSWKTLALTEAFSRASRFDIIHNFFGFLALPFAEMVDTPIVTQLQNEPSPEHGTIFARYMKKTHFVSEGASDGKFHAKTMEGFGLKVTAIQAKSIEDSASKYLGLYKDILAGRENYRPWGHYENLVEGHDHKMKRIIVEPGARLSYQKHKRRAERWVVISGEAVVTLDGEDKRLEPGDTVFIPKGAAHRVSNPGKVVMVFAEVQLGDYFGEDDIIRLEDDYGRSG